MPACLSCNTSFSILKEDQESLKKLSPRIADTIYPLPHPKLCPSCRQIRRMAWRNERNLYTRTCSKSGKQLIGAFSPDKPFPVYDNALWWSEDNDATSFGKPIDFNRSIFSQMEELQKVVPRLNVFNYSEDRMENSRYTNCAGDLKNCYLIFASGRDESCSYCTYINDSFQCMDCFFVMHSNNCYECIDIEGCNHLLYSLNSKDCYDSYFLYDCRGCHDCIGCVGLRKKSYCIFNQQFSKEEFLEQKATLLKNRAAISNTRERFAKLLPTVPRKYIHGDKNENVVGDFVWNSKNCFECYDTANSEDCRYCTWYCDGKDSMDVYAWGETELCYEISGGGDTMYGSLFTALSFGCRNSYYLDLCVYAKNCFACVGLKNKEFCILNKQYTEREYLELVPQLIAHMTTLGEWGEFFPASKSPYGYNETVAGELYPLQRDEALKLGFKWSDYVAPSPKITKSAPAKLTPGNITEVSDDILEVALICAASDKPFKILKEELAFYRQHNLPLPIYHPDERHKLRLEQRNPRKVWARFCERCGGEIHTSYAPERPELVYCEPCYLDSVYTDE